MKYLLLTTLLLATPLLAQNSAALINTIEVRGTPVSKQKQSSRLCTHARGEPLDTKTVQRDLRSLYDLGYFPTSRFYASPTTPV